MVNDLSMELIDEASNFLKNKARITPLELSEKLSSQLGGQVFLKLENLQLTGSFKIRGAFFRLSKLTPAEKKKGVITCSAGNHGKAVSYVAKLLNIPATIYVPKNVDQSKYEAMLMLGAEVVVSPSIGYGETEVLAQKVAKETGKPFIPAYDDYYIMAGNGGSLAKEITEQLQDPKTIAVPVGGGGLSAGLSYYFKKQNPHINIIGCELKESPGLALSLEKGKAMTSLPSIDTVAGGLEGGIGVKTFEVLKTRIDQNALVTEEEIYQGFLWCLENLQYLVEPSGVAVISAALSGKLKIKHFPAVLILTGRNVSLATINKIIDMQDQA